MTFTMRRMAVAIAVSFAVLKAVPLSAQDAAQIKRGQEVYGAQKCQVCHSVGGVGNKNNSLDGVGKKLPAAEIREWIVHPKEMTAKAKSTKKPPMQDKYGSLPAADIDAMVVYLQSLK